MAPENTQLESVLKLLEAAEPSLEAATLAKLLVEMASLAPTEAEGLITVLVSLANTVGRFEAGERGAAPSIVARAVLGEVSDAKRRATFESNIERILKIRAIEITGKAIGVLLDNEHYFCSARTLSEIRPIFASENLEQRAAVIVHQLKIVFHEGPRNATKEIFVACDIDSLRSLQAVLNRAVEKHMKLVDSVGRMGIPVL